MRPRTLFALVLVTPVFLVACGGDGSGDASTATLPGPSPTVEMLSGAPVTSLSIGPDVDLPHDVALIVETGCTECDGPTEGLIRVYRDASGELRTDTLYQRPAEPRDTFISSYALSADASTIVVGVCPGGTCPFLAPAQPGAQTLLYRSNDGGVTWEQLSTPDGVYDVRAVIGDNAILQGPLDDQGFLQHRFVALPGGAEFAPPAPNTDLFMLGGGELVWRTGEGRLLGTSGGDVVSLGEGLQVAWVAGGRFWLDPTGGQFALVVYDEDTKYYLGLFAGGGEPQRFYRLDGYASIGGWLDDRRAIGNAVIPVDSLTTPLPEDFPFRSGSTVTLPAVFDFDAGRVHPVPRPFVDRYGRNRVVAVVQGPFARVAGTGDCLNIWAEPGPTGRILTCAAEGVLLRDLSEERHVDGGAWLRVTTPGGDEGWVAVEFVTR